jgi:MoaA/NifB/PqqE/SkfB family radical SAM enzyme
VLDLSRVHTKDYFCSYNPEKYIDGNPHINLYIQSTPICNGSCEFCGACDSRNINFNFSKLQMILSELPKQVRMRKVSITGGEPLLDIEKTKRIISIAKSMGFYTVLNTNCYSIDRLLEVIDSVDGVNISKHHFNNGINNKIMHLATPCLEEICLSLNSKQRGKIKINSVLQKKGLDSFDNLLHMIEYLGSLGIRELKGISMLPLTEKAKLLFVDMAPIMKDCEQFMNDGYLYDKDMCCCFEFLYVTKKGVPVKCTLRNTFNNQYSCVKQFVFDGEHLYEGFLKKIIIA